MHGWLRVTTTNRRPASICRSTRHSPLHAALRLPRTGAAARADDARGRIERLGDPLDVEHLRGGANAGGGLLRNHAVAAAATISSPSKPWASRAGSRSTPTESTCISSRAARGDVRATELAVRDDSLLFSRRGLFYSG